MKKLFTSLVVVLAIFAGTGQAEAQLWWPGGGFGFGGNEAARVVAGNQAMVWSLGNQWPPYQYPYPYPYPSQYPMAQQVVCAPKPRDHQWKDALGATGLGAGIGLWTGGRRGAIGGAMAGAGGGTLVTNHESDCWPVQPTVIQQLQVVPGQPEQPQVQPSAQGPPIRVEPAPPRLTGIEFIVKNEHPATIVVEIPDGRRAVIGSRLQARVRTPDIRVFLVQPDGRGSFGEFEIELRGTEDSTLPGWRIPPKVRLKSP